VTTHVTTTARVENLDAPGGTRITCQSLATSVPGDDRRYEYEESKRLAAEGDFYPLLMAAMRCADTDNSERLRDAFPEVWEELARSLPGSRWSHRGRARFRGVSPVACPDLDSGYNLTLWRVQLDENSVPCFFAHRSMALRRQTPAAAGEHRPLRREPPTRLAHRPGQTALTVSEPAGALHAAERPVRHSWAAASLAAPRRHSGFPAGKIDRSPA
jgi:hypothetical protein